MSVQNFRPTRAEISGRALSRNTRRLHDAAGAGAALCAVVKADGYGHGLVTAARAALAGGASWLAVALVEEGIMLRDAGVDAPVLVLSEPPEDAAPALVTAALTPTVYRPEFLRALQRASRDRPQAVHVKFDTGMTRVGVAPALRDTMLAALAAAPGIIVEGIQTHLARADEPEDATTTTQLERFAGCLTAVRDAGFSPRYVHVANTAATLVHSAAWRHVIASGAPTAVPLVRTGIGLYGLSPGEQVPAAPYGLEPALRLVSAVSHVQRIAEGTPVSYGHRWAAPAHGWLATVPIGYADGVPRALTGQVDVLHAGLRRPVVGTITMDQLLVWFGDSEPKVGEEIVLIGTSSTPDGAVDRITMEDWASRLNTITYEIATGISARVPRQVVD